MENKKFYKKALFQISYEDKSYLGIFTYDFLTYAYFRYNNKNKKDEEKEISNKSLIKYISLFLNKLLENKEYKIYFISEIFNKKINKNIIYKEDKDDLMNISLDDNIKIDCILDQNSSIFSFLSYNVKKDDFVLCEKEIYEENNLYNNDYNEDEIPFIYEIYRTPENKSKKKIISKKVHKPYDSESSESEYEESDEEEHNEFVEDCKKYEKLYSYYSAEFREKVCDDASKKRSFWRDLEYKVKNVDKELYNYCRNREATQMVRYFIYEDYNLFRVRYLWIITDLHIDNEDNINTDFDNNDDLEVYISFRLKTTKHEVDASVCRSGCYENGGFNTTTNIDYVENVEKRSFKELFLMLFERYNPLDI